MNFLFVNPSSMPSVEMQEFLDKSSILRVPSFSMPIGLVDMTAYVREKMPGLKAQIIDFGKDMYKLYLDNERKAISLDEFVEAELGKAEFEPDVVGISVEYSSAYNASILIAEKVKQKWPDCIVVCGGNHATNFHQFLLKDRNFDFVIRGEGEISLLEMLKQLEKGEKVSVVGAMDREKLSKGIKEISPMIENLDELPMPAYDLLDIEAYRETVGASIMFSRGCVYPCTFCASQTVHGRRVRFKSNEKILAEFRHLVDDLKFGKIIVEDDLFAANKKNFFKLADEMIKYKDRVKYFLPQGLSVHVLDEQIIDIMIKMGINRAAIAIESGSEFTQKNIIKKNIDLEKAKRVLGYLRQKDFYIYVNFILGFPDENMELMQETIDYMKSLDVDWIYIFHALPLPGSELYNTLVERKIIDPEKFDWDDLRLGRRGFDTPEISAKDLQNLVYDTNIEVNFFSASNLRLKRFKRAVEVFNYHILGLYPFHIVGRYCRGLAYQGLGEQEKAEQDFRDCVEWIGKDKESKRLFERYGKRMPLLEKYLQEK